MFFVKSILIKQQHNMTSKQMYISCIGFHSRILNDQHSAIDCFVVEKSAWIY